MEREKRKCSCQPTSKQAFAIRQAAHTVLDAWSHAKVVHDNQAVPISYVFSLDDKAELIARNDQMRAELKELGLNLLHLPGGGGEVGHGPSLFTDEEKDGIGPIFRWMEENGRVVSLNGEDKARRGKLDPCVLIGSVP